MFDEWMRCMRSDYSTVSFARYLMDWRAEVGGQEFGRNSFTVSRTVRWMWHALHAERMLVFWLLFFGGTAWFPILVPLAVPVLRFYFLRSPYFWLTLTVPLTRIHFGKVFSISPCIDAVKTTDAYKRLGIHYFAMWCHVYFSSTRLCSFILDTNNHSQSVWPGSWDLGETGYENELAEMWRKETKDCVCSTGSEAVREHVPAFLVYLVRELCLWK